MPKPRVNLTRFHGVFPPSSKHRALVTPAKRGRGNKARVADEPSTPAERRAPMTWAKRQGICLEYIQPGQPQQYAYIERYNRTVRYAWLSQYGAGGHYANAETG